MLIFVPMKIAQAAEALGAIGLESNLPLLKESLASDPAQEVRETCELALSRIKELDDAKSNGDTSSLEPSPFLSVDPAAPASCSSVPHLRFVTLKMVTIASIGFCM